MKTNSIFQLIAAMISVSGICGTIANAGGMESGGGQGVFCRNTNSVEAFDYYEARTVRGIEANLGNPSQDFMGKVTAVIKRIELLDPARAGKYMARAATFLSESKFIPNIELPEIPDSNGIALPTGCELKQVAVQRVPVFPQDPYYVINKNLWDLMPNDSKAGLVLHEIIYREARARGQVDSVKSRYYNSVISSDLISKYTLNEYLDLTNLSDLQVEFLWQDSKTGVSWYLFDKETNNNSEQSAKKVCAEINARPAYERDLVLAYPALANALQSYREFDRGGLYVMIGDDYWGGYGYKLTATDFRKDFNQPRYHRGQTLCVYDSN